MAAGPVLIGAVAGLIGLRLALAIPVLLALWIVAAARVLGVSGLTVGSGIAIDAVTESGCARD
jgi:hypothetical protein